ncbi:MAG TPA: nucleotidyltransferase family protein [Bryobacteraceae bacterium]|nr:nucleotidyltransferase family protein [Bryobacteraceae bacterium]
MESVSTLPYQKADIALLLSVCREELGTADSFANNASLLDDRKHRGLLAAARDHGLLGPLHKTALNIYAASDKMVSSIRTAYLAQVARNLQLIAVLNEVLCELRRYSIEAAVLKGPAVAFIAYSGEIAHREFTDLDILVRPGDLKQARVVLKDLGYRQISADVLDMDTAKDIEFLRDNDQVFVELHWALNPPISRYPLEATGVWNRLQTISLFSSSLQTLGLEDTLIYLCIHSSKHHWRNLKWTFDIAQLLKYKVCDIDWDTMLERCSVVGCSGTVSFGIQLASLLFSVEIPVVMRPLIAKNRSITRLVRCVGDSLSKGKPLSEADLIRCQIEVHDRLEDRLWAMKLSYPDLPRLLPNALRPLTAGRLGVLTRLVRFFSMYGFNWVRAVIVGR